MICAGMYFLIGIGFALYVDSLVLTDEQVNAVTHKWKELGFGDLSRGSSSYKALLRILLLFIVLFWLPLVICEACLQLRQWRKRSGRR